MRSQLALRLLQRRRQELVRAQPSDPRRCQRHVAQSLRPPARHVLRERLPHVQVNLRQDRQRRDPSVLQTLARCRALVRVDGEHAADEVLGGRADAIPGVTGEGEAALLHHEQHLRHVVAQERRGATEHGIQDRASRPHVHLGGVEALLKAPIEGDVHNLRSNVLGGAARGRHGVEDRVPLDGRKPEVSDLHVVVCGRGGIAAHEEDVLWLDIAVADAMTVEVLEAGQHLLEQQPRVSLREVILPGDANQEFSASCKLLDQEDVQVIVEDVDQPDAALVFYPPHDHQLLQVSQSANRLPARYSHARSSSTSS
eukprot:334214-Hanusia_phi.AAC.2